jgi:formylglycine-generating enzyme
MGQRRRRISFPDAAAVGQATNLGSSAVVRARTKSVLKAIGAGSLLGGVALASRYAPAWDGGAASAPAASCPTAAVASSSSPPVPLAVAPDLTAQSFPTPRAARFDADPALRGVCPASMALVDGEFCPDLPYECVRPTRTVGCAEYARGKRCLGEADHRRYCIDQHEWPNRVGENPAVYVDWFEAKALCAEAGKRLCRRSEWILACEGPKRLPFPWGFERQPSPCNVDRASIPFDVEAMIDASTREGELSRLWQADRIGSHPDCVSAFGAYDQAGNVDEWTDDLADNPGTKHPSTLNGGYWGPVRDTCRLTTTSHGPTFKFYQVGFRCCADPIDGSAVAPPRPWIEPEPEPEPEPKPVHPG